ncbi:hypothetical protein EJB05_14895, partial [Eragrostis curvula]
MVCNSTPNITKAQHRNALWKMEMLAFYSMLESTVLKRWNVLRCYDNNHQIYAISTHSNLIEDSQSCCISSPLLKMVSFTSKNCSECKIRVGSGANSSALFPAWNPKDAFPASESKNTSKNDKNAI